MSTCVATLVDKLGEIISRVERRRKWTPQQKIKILTEVLEPEATVSAVADRTGSAAASSMPGRSSRDEGLFPAYP